MCEKQQEKKKEGGVVLRRCGT